MKRGQEPTFPSDEYGYINEDKPFNLIHQNLGISTRLLIAKDAMVGILGNSDSMREITKQYEKIRYEGKKSFYDCIAFVALEYADALIKAEEESR